MKKLSLALVFVIPAITGWSLKNPIAESSRKFSASQITFKSMFSFFNAHREGKNAVALMWKSSAGSEVISYQVEKSYDGEFFDPVGGQANSHASNYFWTDSNALPGYLYYRVAASMANGEVIYSDVAMVHITQH